MNLSPSDLAAWWGAVVATIVFGWDIYKWRSDGPHVALELSPNMIVIGDPAREGKKWVSVTITNTGTRPTTLKGIGLEHYANPTRRLRGKTEMAAVFPNPNDHHPLPRMLNPGEEWRGLIPQERPDKGLSLKEMANQGHLLIWASVSHKKKPIKTRLTFPNEKA